MIGKNNIRKVNKEDMLLLFNWINDESVREMSFNKDLISLEKHKSWFSTKLYDENTLFYILESDNTPSGAIRYEKKNDRILLNYLISKQFRGKGLAPIMLNLSLQSLRFNWGKVKIYAQTLRNNFASIRSLEKVGFQKYYQKKNKLYFIYFFDKKGYENV